MNISITALNPSRLSQPHSNCELTEVESKVFPAQSFSGLSPESADKNGTSKNGTSRNANSRRDEQDIFLPVRGKNLQKPSQDRIALVKGKCEEADANKDDTWGM